MVSREGSAAELAARISDVFVSDRAELGRAARKRVQENYTMRKIAERLREFTLAVGNLPLPGGPLRDAGAAEQDYADVLSPR